MTQAKVLPRQIGENEHCPKCGRVIPTSWHGQFKLHVTVPQAEIDKLVPDLHAIGAHLGQTLCWQCLGKALEMLLGWLGRDIE